MATQSWIHIPLEWTERLQAENSRKGLYRKETEYPIYFTILPPSADWTVRVRHNHAPPDDVFSLVNLRVLHEILVHQSERLIRISSGMNEYCSKYILPGFSLLCPSNDSIFNDIPDSSPPNRPNLFI